MQAAVKLIIVDFNFDPPEEKSSRFVKNRMAKFHSQKQCNVKR